MRDKITGPNPNASASFPKVPVTPATPMTNPARSPLQSPNPKIRQAWQTALWRIRKKNRAGRPPL